MLRSVMEVASFERETELQAAAPYGDGWTYFDSPQRISAVQTPGTPAASVGVGSDGVDEDFEFPSPVGSRETRPTITADEIFCDGKILPVYPVFNRDLLTSGVEKFVRQPLLRFLIEERGATGSPPSSSLLDDLDGIPPETYCVWKPGSAAQSPGQVRKSSSTGTCRRRRIRDFMVGRSNSDGKEKFMFLASKEKIRSGEKNVIGGEKKMGNGKGGTEMDLLTAHRMYYGQNGHRSKGSEVRRKSYLPYKPGILGFFARVDGLSRVHHPF